MPKQKLLQAALLAAPHVCTVSRWAILPLLVAASGDAFRGAGGLALGYAMRPFLKVEQLLYPVYNWGLALFFPNAGYEVSKFAAGA